MIVEEPHGVVGRKTDMQRGFVELFERPIEGRTHAVCCVASALHQAYVQFVARIRGQVDCLAFCVGGIIFCQVDTFVLCGGDAVIKEQVVTFAQPLKRLSDVLLPCYFALLAVFFSGQT